MTTNCQKTGIKKGKHMAKFNIKKASDSLQHGLKVLLYAVSGTGKTTMVGTLPGKTLLLNAENGTLVLKECDNADNIDIIDVKTTSELSEVYLALKSGELKYDNVVLDSLSEIGENLFSDIEADPTVDKEFGGLYTTFRKRLTEIIKAFRDLKGVNVVLIALADEVDINGIVRTMPALPHKKTQASIIALFDECLFLESDAEGTRHVRTTDSSMHMAKSRMHIEDNGTVLDFGKLYPELLTIEKTTEKEGK